MNLLKKVVTFDKYANFLPEENRRETWRETVRRPFDMHRKKFPELTEELDRIEQMVLEGRVVPSMRSLQFGGPAIERHNEKLYNCCYTAIDDVWTFAEIMFLLLCGCGVGYSVQQRHISSLQICEVPDKQNTVIYTIPDSIEGWADSVQVLIHSYLSHKREYVELDYSQIRPEGALIRSSGAQAPGPQPLRRAHENIRDILEGADGRKLRPIEVHDMTCHIADAVLSGGVRRSAMICLFDRDDEEMKFCKSGNWYETDLQRARANNSGVFMRGEVTKDEYDAYWQDIRHNGSGEPGFVWTNDYDLGMNPCQPADATLLTPDGLSTMGCVEVGDKIWSESGWTTVVNKWSTGVKKVYKFFTANGYFYGTKNHRIVSDGSKVEVKDAGSIDVLLGPKKEGWMYREGQPVEHTGYSRHAQLMLSAEHIPSYVDEEGVLRYGKGSTKIASVEYCGEMEVFDITVDNEPHTYWTGGLNVSNCAEISLKSNQFCNLTEGNAQIARNQEELEEIVWAAALLGTIQATYTDFSYLRDIWRHTTEEDALLGVSMTGIAGMQFEPDLEAAAQVAVDVNKEYADILGINQAARVTCVKPSGTTSCVLGTSSGIHAWHNDYYIRRMGIKKTNPLYAFMKDHAPAMVEQSVYSDEDANLKFPIKAPEGATLRHESALAFLERVKTWNTKWVAGGYNRGLNPHNVSATVSIQEHEWDPVADWMWENRAHYTGLSFLPYDGGTYAQAPFTDCTKKEYEELASTTPDDLDLSEIVETRNNTKLHETVACSGGACEITSLG